MRHAIEQLIPLELRLDEVEDVPIWGNGRCMIHAMGAHTDGAAAYRSVAREEEGDGSPGKPKNLMDQAAVSALVRYKSLALNRYCTSFTLHLCIRYSRSCTHHLCMYYSHSFTLTFALDMYA